MSTSTPRLQLTKPLGSESMKLGASQISDAYAKIDAAMGVKKFATQGAATAVFNGDLIQETSTGQAKLFNNPNWMNLWDPNNGRGKPQDIAPGDDAMVVSGFPEQSIDGCILTVEAGRKYFVNVNLSLSAVNDGGSLFIGYLRLIFKYTLNLNPLIIPNIVIHDVSSVISAQNSARSKSFKCMFEFFPNVTQDVQFGIFGQIITGDQDAEVNLVGSNPRIYMTDWGV